MGMFKMVGYHGTDRSVVENITKEGFKCKPNKEHWLGEGIYLYKDEELAIWWTTNPTEKHGIDIVEPAIIECLIEVKEERVLNLCSLSGYRRYVNLYNTFFRDWTYTFRPKNEINFKELRCAFFNYLFALYEVDVIVAPFIVPKQPYMPRYLNESYVSEMHIMYAEVQICISKEGKDVIKNKSVKFLKRECEYEE